MKAMLLPGITDLQTNPFPLIMGEIPTPVPGPRDVLIKVSVCGVCHTELDEIEGRTPPARYPMILGHQVVGQVIGKGSLVNSIDIGARVGVAWIFSTCGTCEFCRSGQENLCKQFVATGRDVNGGYAEFMIAPELYVHPLPDALNDVQAAPLLCAGAIGYRSIRLARMKNGQTLGMTGFGASAHLVLKMVRYQWPDIRMFVFARSAQERAYAIELGAIWAGDTKERSPEMLDVIIDTTPAWLPVVEALVNLKPGGRLVINAIRKESHDQQDLSKIQYEQHLWMEKEIKSVANVTRADVREFLDLCVKANIQPEMQVYPLHEANRALLDLKNGAIRGAKVLRIDTPA